MRTGVCLTRSSLGSWGLAAGPPVRGMLLGGSTGFCVRSCPSSESESLGSLFSRLDYERITNDLFYVPQRAAGRTRQRGRKIALTVSETRVPVQLCIFSFDVKHLNVNTIYVVTQSSSFQLFGHTERHVGS